MREFVLVIGAVAAANGRPAKCPALHQCNHMCQGPTEVSRLDASSKKPECPPGVGMLWDDCECCRKCAKQKDDNCDMMNPCDKTKGLSCQKIDKKGDGICLPMPGGKTCFVQGREYENGEEFQPGRSCSYTGICVNGDIGVFPTCSRKPPSNCQNARLCRPKKGECCGTWTCGNKGSRECQTVDQVGSMLNVPTHLSAHRQPEISATFREDDNCYIQTTSWSPCSRDRCGWGIRERISNNNTKCEMHKETKLCQVRPCGNEYDNELQSLLESRKYKDKMCLRTVRKPEAVKFTFSGCQSKRTYKPRYCGKCKDSKCCLPDKTETLEVDFVCDKDGQTFKKKIDNIQSCKCDDKCLDSIDIFSSMKLLRNDFHRGK